jgi:hypothetical protein
MVAVARTRRERRLYLWAGDSAGDGNPYKYSAHCVGSFFEMRQAGFRLARGSGLS